MLDPGLAARADHSPVNHSNDPGGQHAHRKNSGEAQSARRRRRSDRDRSTNHAPDGKFLQELTGA
jgi:hypothetical protein